MLRIVDVPPARELVTALPVLSPTLAIPLAGDSRVATSRLANLASGQDEVDTRQTVFGALGMMFNTPGMQEHGGRRCAPPLRRLDNRRRWHPGERCHTFWSVVGDRLPHRLKALGVLRNEGVIDPAARQTDMQETVHEGTVASRAYRQEEVGRACDRGHAWINDNDPGAIVSRPPDIIGENGKTLPDIDTSQDETFGQRDVTPRLSASVNAKRHAVRGTRRHHAEAPLVIDVLCAQCQTSRLPDEIRLLVG